MEDLPRRKGSEDMVDEVAKDKTIENVSSLDQSILTLTDAYNALLQILSWYLDMKENEKKSVAVWILGANVYDFFDTFPYLYLNAMKGSGKTRLMRLCAYLLEGDVTTNVTDAVLFREKTPLFIDEAENMNIMEQGNLIQLLNSGYKKGHVVKRVEREEGKFEVQDFDPFRPIGIANIEGLNDVTEDRSIKVILEKSTNKEITRRPEMFARDKLVYTVRDFLSSFSASGDSLDPLGVVGVVILARCIKECYNYTADRLMESNIHNTTITYTTTHTYTQYTNDTITIGDLILSKLEKTELLGRDLELWFPLFVVSAMISEEVLDEIIKNAETESELRRQNNLIENRDIVMISFLYSFINGRRESDFLSINEIVNAFVSDNPDEVDSFTSRWLGRALVRNGLVKKRRRLGKGIEVILNFMKVNQKARQFGVIEGLAGFLPEKSGMTCEICGAGNRLVQKIPNRFNNMREALMCEECKKEYAPRV